MVFLVAIATFCIVMALTLGHEATLDVPYLADPPSVYLEHAYCEVEHKDSGAYYYLQGTDETGDQNSFPVDKNLFGKITGGTVRVKYLPNTNVAMNVKYQ